MRYNKQMSPKDIMEIELGKSRGICKYFNAFTM